MLTHLTEKNSKQLDGWNYGFRFRCYLGNRKYILSINRLHSNRTDIKFGVPKGFILGILLVFWNDLHFANKYCKKKSFTDDISLTLFRMGVFGAAQEWGEG